ncbi:MAG: aspartate-semialdehyde dehydrogenase [Deltaproteobacteria bacterium]|nr:aspartate-semialdehyde dehydrogenase [Deltaproteobacteria bacterium]
MTTNGFTVAVVGATGAVGEEMIRVLEQRDFPVAQLRPLASERSFGDAVTFRDAEVPVAVLNVESFRGVDVALFSAGTDVSREFCGIAAKAGALVVDNSAAFRMEPDVALVVPEVNAAACADWRRRGIIANPNCSTIQLCVALHPLQQAVGLERVIVATYQSVSGAGRAAMETLETETRALLSGEETAPTAFPHPIAFNCLPHIDQFLDNGYTKEEWKVIEETRKILSLPQLPVTATAVRVPVFVGHSEAVHCSTTRPITAAAARELLRQAPGIVVVDDPSQLAYPLARTAAGQDAVFVGRIREDVGLPNGLALWVVADNLRKGAALNAVEIAEIVVNRYWAN